MAEALVIRCPNCNQYCSAKVEITEQDAQVFESFSQLSGLNYLSGRIRARVCGGCGDLFKTTEVPFDHLQPILDYSRFIESSYYRKTEWDRAKMLEIPDRLRAHLSICLDIIEQVGFMYLVDDVPRGWDLAHMDTQELAELTAECEILLESMSAIEQIFLCPWRPILVRSSDSVTPSSARLSMSRVRQKMMHPSRSKIVRELSASLTRRRDGELN